MTSWIWKAFAVLVISAAPGAPGGLVAQPSAASAPPEWFVEHNAFLSQKGGRWIADNSAYKSEDEPFDAYGLEWKPGLGDKTLTGRLFGLQDGKDIGTFWEFRVLWHPGEGRAYVHQFGSDGTYGTGTVEHAGEGKVQITQDFYGPDGTRSRLRHDSTHGPGEWVHDQSYGLAEDGTWVERRAYEWKLTPAE